MPDEEEWRPIPEFPGYEVSSLGRVKSYREDRGGLILSPARTKAGYPLLRLRRDGRYHARYVHRIVAAVFVGPPPPGCEVCHNNGIPSDCRAVNLRWATHRENILDAVRHGTMKGTSSPGEKHPMCRLTADDVQTIRKLRSCGLSLADIGLRFGITATHACRITKGKSWHHLPPAISPRLPHDSP